MMLGKRALDAESGYEYETGDFKRQKVEPRDVEGYEQTSYENVGPGNPHFQQPSAVIHVRGVADEAREQDLLHALSSFGTIRSVYARYITEFIQMRLLIRSSFI